MTRLNQAYPGVHFLIDADGQDVLDGTDRAELLAQAGNSPSIIARDEMVIRRSSADNRYHFVVVASPPGIAGTAPYYLWIPVAMVLACLFLVHRMIRPIRRLQAVVKQFGDGDLRVRSGVARKDEIGQLSVDFDRMAEKIERLVVAERQLLQDVSHELRSPLARLAFALELARTARIMPVR